MRKDKQGAIRNDNRGTLTLRGIGNYPPVSGIRRIYVFGFLVIGNLYEKPQDAPQG
jgi:hypothetical protein